MAMKRKIKILLIVVFLIVLIPVLLIFVFPYFDFMYVSADKHWLKGKIADQDDNTGGKSIKKVEQGENVEYFVYKDRLMCKEIYKKKVLFSEQSDPEIFSTDEHIFIYEYSKDYEKICITRINRDGSKPVLIIDENGEIVMKPL